MALDVLLLEDDPAKKNRLLAFLNERNDLFRHVDLAICTADAIRKMQERRFDLLIADIVVPASLGGEKSEEHSISMFERIDDLVDDINPPRFSLPVSASNEISQSVYEFFRGRPWGVLQYNDTNSESIETIEKVAQYVLAQGQGAAAPALACDVFIITALMEPEFSAIENLDVSWGALQPLDSSQLIRFGEVSSGGRMYKVAAAFAPRMGPVASAVLATKGVLTLNPKLVIMSGICAGMPQKAEIGDVIAAEVSWDWQSGKYIDANGVEQFQISPHQIVLPDAVRNQLLLLKRDQEFWNSLAINAVEFKKPIPKLVLGPMATGSSVLADARVSERIKSQQHKNLSGLDMETYGVYAAVQSCRPDINVIALKAVCDQGDMQKDDQYQSYASFVSAKATLHFIKAFARPLLED
ncbi:Response regulator receiver domain protein [Ectopseudomonas mendocina]|uniref:phosphorylase family protein n=1 Tax=Ectopseudomonas mendocina TaxID=300 RepID=UPI000E0827FB|nr:hypothetical protein [Pseudomonas mendocina]SUD34357.1 Response regulator receiver domain protein [Pseudomonas mendocina]